MAATQLFVGRLPRNTRSRDMEDIFYRYGKMTRCDIKQGDTNSVGVYLTIVTFHCSCPGLKMGKLQLLFFFFWPPRIFVHVCYIAYGFIEYEDKRDAEVSLISVLDCAQLFLCRTSTVSS